MATSAIVRYAPPPETRAATSETKPFFAFLKALRERNSTRAKTDGGGALWSALPVERIVADGILPVLVHIAKTLGVRVQTETQIQILAERLQPFLDVGLELCYPSMEKATEIFEQTISDHLKKQRQGLNTPASILWSEASAHFFAAAVKAAVEYGRELAELAKEISDQNEMIVNGVCCEIINNLHGQQKWVFEFSPKGNPTDLPTIREICGIRDHLVRCKHLQKSLRILLHNAASAKTQATRRMSDSPIEERWFQTQILRAALGLRFGPYVTALQYTQGIRRLKRIRTGEITERFFTSGEPESSKLDGKQRNIVSVHLKMCVDPSFDGDTRCMRLWGEGVDHAANDRVSVLWKPEEFVMTNPLDVALGTAPNPFEKLARGKRSLLVQERITKHIRWTSLKPDDFNQMIETHVVPATIVFRHLLKMGKRGISVLKRHLGHKDAEPVRMSLLKQRTIQADFSFFENHGNALTTKEWRRLLREFFKIFSGEPANHETLVDLLVIAASRMREEGGESIASARWRPELIKAIYSDEIIKILILTQKNRNQQNAYRLFIDAIGGEKIWRKLILACEILHRMGLYLDWRKMKKEDTLPPVWKEMGETGSDWLDLQLVLDITRKKLQDLLEQETEKAVFDWMHEGKKDRKQRWERYISSRKRLEQHFLSLS